MGSGMKILLRNKWLILTFAILYPIHLIFKKSAYHYDNILSYYLGDFLCMPLVLSIGLIAIQNLTQFHIWQLTKLQIGITTILYALLFEWLFPQYFTNLVADPIDIVMYVLGSLIFTVFINPIKSTWHDFRNSQLKN